MTFQIEVDHEHGGRWRSLRDPSGREWCWSRPHPRRGRARPGDAFVDVGGVEECFPTVAGAPDHGDLWTRPWTRDDHGGFSVQTAEFRFRRKLVVGRDVQVTYVLEAAPGFRFVWAFHLLVVPTPDLTLRLPGNMLRTWPDGYEGSPVETQWPFASGRVRFDRPGPDDGTATFALAPGSREVTVSSAGRALRMRVSADTQPVAIGLWRNLSGWSWDGSRSYRSIGVEPMIGHNPARQHAVEHDLGTVGRGGQVTWSLRISQPAA